MQQGCRTSGLLFYSATRLHIVVVLLLTRIIDLSGSRQI
jgi:hypothetical protein